MSKPACPRQAWHLVEWYEDEFKNFELKVRHDAPYFQLSLNVVYVQNSGAGKLPAEYRFEGDI